MSKKITKKEFMDQYGDVVVSFSSYYKYSFTFRGTKNGESIRVCLGGNHSDIYRFEVDADCKSKIKDMDDWMMTSGSVYSPDSCKEILYFVD